MGQKFSSKPSEPFDTYYVSNNKTIKNLPPNIKKIFFCSRSNNENAPTMLLGNNFYVKTIRLNKIHGYNKSMESLPPKLKELYLHYSYNTKIYFFPSNLEILDCGDEFYVRQIKIPNTLRILHIRNSVNLCDNDFNNLQSISLLDNLEELYFYYYDDYTYENIFTQCFINLFNNLPKKLKILKMPELLNIPLLNLPLGLEKLYLGINFNQSLDSLPETIKYIMFDEMYKFNKPLDNLPSGVEYLNLQFQNKYFHTINNLPNSIKYLELGEYKLPINKLPKELEELIIASPVEFKMMEIDAHIKTYELLYIGEFNTSNKISIEIPNNLKKIIWYNNDCSVYQYEKNQNNGIEFWFESDK